MHERQQREQTWARLLEDTVAVAEQQAAAGLASAFEWQLLRLEANTARLDAAESITTVAAAAARLATALSLPVQALGSLPLAPARAIPRGLNYAALQSAALQRHPRVLAALADYDKHEHDLEQVIASQFPDLRLSPGYLFDQGDNVWSLVGGIVVPLSAQFDASVRRAERARDAARAAFEQTQADVIGGLQQAWARYRAFNEALAGVRDAEQALVTDLAALQAAPALEAGDALLVRRAELAQARTAGRRRQLETDRSRALVELEAAAAMPLDDAAFTKQLEALYRTAEDP